VLNQGWGRGDCGSGSRRLQSAARFKSKGGERVRSNNHQSKCFIPPTWKITVDYTAQIITKEIKVADSLISILSLQFVYLYYY
jgi:predicted deacetylase